MAETVRCASCGWTMETAQTADAAFMGATHLVACSKRDDLRFVPWWTILDGVLEVGWHTLDVSEPTPRASIAGVLTWHVPLRRYRFTEYADRVLIGVKT
jgi:hypothetical protein